jgi:hypothetical protein
MSDLLNRFIRKLRILVYRLRKESIVISNNTNTKIFIERKDGDFSAKKAVKIPPGTTMTVVVSFYRGNVLFIRDVKRRLLEISAPVFQVEVVHGKEPGTYEFRDFN